MPHVGTHSVTVASLQKLLPWLAEARLTWPARNLSGQTPNDVRDGTGLEHRSGAKRRAVARATKTLRGVEGCWVKDLNVLIEDGNIKGYKVNVEVTFLLEE